MKRFLFFIVFTIITFVLQSQTPAIEWAVSLGGINAEVAYDVQQTTDGGYIMAGRTNSNDGDVSGNHGNYDYWIVKLDAFGNITWQKCLGGSAYDYAYSIRQTTDGGYIVAGYSDSNDGDVSGNHGASDYWIVKLDTAGNIAWQKCLGGSNYDYARSIRQTTDGGYIVGGYTYSNDGDVTTNGGSYDYWIVKLDTIGNIVWQKSFWGVSSEQAYDVQQTSDNGYVVAGFNSVSSADYWIIKLDTAGNMVWPQSMGGSNNDASYSIQQTIDGGYIVAGSAASNNGDVVGNHGYEDYWIIKLDAAGNMVWQKCLGSVSSDIAYSIQQTIDGGYIVAGYTLGNDGDVTGNHGNSDYWIAKLDNAGNMVWQKCLGGSLYENSNSIQQTTDGGYIVAGYANSNDGDVAGNNGSDDAWVVKLYAERVSISSFSPDTTICINSDIDLNFAYDSYYIDDTIQWFLNDSLIAGVSDTVIHLVNVQESDTGMYSCVVSNSLGYSDTAYIHVGIYPDFQINLTGQSSLCFGDTTVVTALITGGTTPFQYQWSTGDTTNQVITVTDSTTVYYATVTDNYSCTHTAQTTIQMIHPDTVSICLVSVDTLTGKSMVIWERPISQKTVEFNIYRETGVNIFDLVGTVPWDSMTVFIDSTSNPSAYAQKYKISTVDTCGNESALSYYHKTIYLGISAGFPGYVLDWTNYEDESGSFQPVRYYIYRKNTSLGGGYQLIDSVPATITNYNDVSPPSGTNYYFVSTNHDNCIPSNTNKANGGPYSQSTSNLEDDGIISGIGSDSQKEVYIYPNPNKGEFTVISYKYTNSLISVYDITGNLVIETNSTGLKTNIDISGMSKGIYIVEIANNDSIGKFRVVVE